METTVTVQEAMALYQNGFITEAEFNTFMNMKAKEVRNVINQNKSATTILDEMDDVPDLEFDGEPLGPVIK